MPRSVRSGWAAPAALTVIALSLCFVPTRGADAPRPPEAGSPGEKKALVLRNATIHTAAADAPVRDGVLVVRDGKVVAVGTADVVDVPADAEVRDLKGAGIIPRPVDTHSHIGGVVPPGGSGSNGNSG